MSKYRYTDEGRKHLHELDKGEGYAPLIGTTTALNEVFPPPLAWWGSAMALEKFGWITEKKFRELNEDKIKSFPLKEEADRFVGETMADMLANGQDEIRLAADMDLEDYRNLLEECYRNHDEYKKSKGKAGTDIHAKIENFIKKCISRTEPMPIEDMQGIEAFVDWARRDVKKFLWSEAHVFSEKLWLGGITDFGFIHNNGKMIVGDVKPSVYPKNFIQTALYGIQIKENGLFDAEGNQTLQDQLVPTTIGDGTRAIPQIDGYCIFDYNKGIAMYRTDVERLESYGTLAIDLYKHKDIIGTPTL